MTSVQWQKPKCRRTPGKAAFRNQSQAQKVADRIWVENAQAVAPVTTVPLRPYACECGAWHLTKRPA